MAYSIGFVPYYVDGTEPTASANTTVSSGGSLAYSVGTIETGVALSSLPMLGDTDSLAIPAEPVRIVIPSIGIDLPVSNPTSANNAVLDKALTSSVVRYPGSAMLGQKGNVLIFGHSSHLPVIHNHFYKAFNDLPELTVGDIISLESESQSYQYQVTSVRHTDATEENIDLSTTGGARLTLSTCDTFGKKTARWVVEAEFIGAVSLAN